MSAFRKLTALFLCLCLIFGMVGCGAEPVSTEAPTDAPTQPATEPAAEPTAAELYTAAYEAAKEKNSLMMNVLSEKTITVAGQTFLQSDDQTLYYTGLGTDDLAYRSIETYDYAGLVEFIYEEIYSGGKLYTGLDYSSYFVGEMDVEDAALRYLTPMMLDASLYESVTQDENGTFTFTSPTAAESWAMPKSAEMTEASGTATLDSDGMLKDLSYSITFTYGPAEITLKVDATVTFGPTTVNAPSNADKYLPLQDVDAVYLTMNATGMLLQSKSISASALESTMSQAAAVVRNQSTTVNYFVTDADLSAKIETGIYLKDYTVDKTQELDQEEIYLNGKYTVSTDDGEPVEESGVTDQIIDNYCFQMITSHITDLSNWKDTVISDLGSLLLIEYTYTDAFGDSVEQSICNTFWNDGNFLRNLSSNYVVNEASGYLSVDKFLGLPTAAGYYYEGTHTIQGGDYLLTFQSDQSIDGAAMDTYYNITEEMLPEAEPENKATPLFYHVTGQNGQEMWLLGTIHVGDERTGYLPQEIYDAFAASDALALEFDSEAFNDAVEADDDLQNQVSDAYYYSDGTAAEDHVDEEIYPEAVKLMKATGNYSMNAPYLKVSMWSNSIENFYLRQGYALTGEQGVEERLTKLAHDQNKPILDVESGLFQIRMLTGWSEDLQEALLEDALDTNALDYMEGVSELFEMWCEGDEAALRDELSDEVDTSEMTEEELAEYEESKHLIEEYNKAMSYDRNDGMLQVAISYLESGDTVFYAVGLAHLLNNVNGLVDTLRAAGYTVELVEYAN